MKYRRKKFSWQINEFKNNVNLNKNETNNNNKMLGFEEFDSTLKGKSEQLKDEINWIKSPKIKIQFHILIIINLYLKQKYFRKFTRIIYSNYK